MASSSEQVDVYGRLNKNLALLQAGSVITLDITTPAGQKKKLRTTFIGYLPKQYVLIQFPEPSKLGSFAQYVKQGTSVTIRGLIEGHEGAVVAFISQIKQTLQLPSRILVIDFPKSVSLQSLRSAMRIDTKISAKIKVDDEYWVATITDLSVNGCHLDINNGESLVLADKKSVLIVIEDFQGMHNIKLDAEICNIKQQVQGVSFGVKFKPEGKKQVTDLLYQAVTVEE